MKKITEDSIKEFFGDKTFLKGLDYYDSGYVSSTVKIENVLFAEVVGSAPGPYEVKASISDPEITTSCTCPVGFMCKHGAALLLKWVHEPESFTDADKFILSLEKRSKNEIINIISKVIKQNPSLISEFSLEKEEKPEVNIEAISEKIGWIVHGELDYYHIGDAVSDLEEIKNIADRLKEKGSYQSASLVYLELVKGGVTAYDEGADDSDGSLGDFVSGCINDFNECMTKIDDLSYKNKILGRILDVVEGEDYGLETQEMLRGIVTEENIQRVEEYLLEKLKEKKKTASDFSYKYKKDGTIELLIELYDLLGKPEEKLLLARYELADKDDYARLAKVLADDGKPEEAFDTIKKGLALPGEPSLRLNELYLDIARSLCRQKPDLVDFKTSLDVAFNVMSRRFDKEKYGVIKEIFSNIGKLDEFKSAILKSFKDRNNAVIAFLHDDDLKTAIDLIRSEPGISSGIIIEVSRDAKDKGMKEESALLTRMVLERGWTDKRPPTGELVKLMIDVSDMDTLKDMCSSVLKTKNAGSAILG